MNQKRKWKVLSAALLLAGMFTVAGCEKGVVEGTRETSTSTSTTSDNHVAGEVSTYNKTDTDNDGIVQVLNGQLTATLTGVVLDDLGYPVADAQVSVFGQTTRTTAGGTWIVNGVPVSQVVTQAALAGVSQGVGNSNQGAGAAPRTVATVPVSVWKSGYTSAVVYVGTTAVIYDSNASLSNTAAGGATNFNNSGSTQPNTIVVGGLTGTSGDVVLKRKASKVVGYLRSASNGTPVSGAILSLSPTRNNNVVGTPNIGTSNLVTFEDQNMTNLAAGQHQAGTVVYGYEVVSATVGSDAKFTFTDVANATNFAIHINSENWYPVAAPTNIGNVNTGVAGNSGANFAVNIAADGTVTPNLADGTLVRPQQNGIASTTLLFVAVTNKLYLANTTTGAAISTVAPAVTNQTNFGLTAVQLNLNPVLTSSSNFNNDPAAQSLAPSINPVGTTGSNCATLTGTAPCGSFWAVTVNHNETLSVGNLFASNIFSVDNINPYVSTVDNAFELQWGFPYVSLDDTVDLRTVPLRFVFSEEIVRDRMDFNDDGTLAASAISVLLFYGKQGETEQRLFVDGTKTQLNNVGGRAILDIYADGITADLLKTLKSGAYVYVLLKQSDFRDTSALPNYLSVPPQANLAIVPDLYRAITGGTNLIVSKPVNVSNASLNDANSYFNYWRYQVKLYQEPDPTPRPTLPLPNLRQITCTNVIQYKETFSQLNPTVLTNKQEVAANRGSGEILNGVVGQTHDNVVNSALCDYDNTLLASGTRSPANALAANGDYDVANVFQLNAASLPTQTGSTISRLAFLAKTLGGTTDAATLYTGWRTDVTAQGGKVLADVGFIEVGAVRSWTGAQGLVNGATYRVTVSRAPTSILTQATAATTSTVSQLAVVTDATGSQFNTDGSKYYMAVSGSSVAFEFKAKDTLHRIWLSGVQPGDTIGVVPVRNTAGVAVSPDVNQNARNNVLTLDDLTPPAIAVQSENLSIVGSTGSVTQGAGDVAGEVLIGKGGSRKWYPVLNLTASLYSRTSSRSTYGKTDGVTTPLLRLTNSGPTAQSYSEADFVSWETAGQTASSTEFSRTTRDLIVEATEPFEAVLSYNSLNNAGVAANQLGFGTSSRTMVIAPNDTEVDNLRKAGGVAQLGGLYPTVTTNAISSTAAWAAFERYAQANASSSAGLVEAGSLDAELYGLRSYEGGGALNAILVATLADWRNVQNDSLLTLIGLRDVNRNEVIRDDVGVIFKDLTPPMARRAVLGSLTAAAETTLQIVFDQPIQTVPGQTLVLRNADNSVSYTFTFTDSRSTATSGGAVATGAGTVISSTTYTDARGRSLVAGNSAPITFSITPASTAGALVTQSNGVAVTYTSFATTLSLTVTNAANLTSTTGTPEFRAFFDRLGNNPWVIWDGVADTTSTSNRWGLITSTANTTASSTLRNDAYYCATTSGASCLSPAVISTEFVTPKLDYLADSDALRNQPCHDIGLGNGIAGSTTSTVTEGGSSNSRSTCYTLATTPTTEDVHVFLNIRHTTASSGSIATQVNHFLPLRQGMASSGITVPSSANGTAFAAGTTINGTEAAAYLVARNTDGIWSSSDTGLETIRVGNFSTTTRAVEIDVNVADSAASVISTGSFGLTVNNANITVTRGQENYVLNFTFREPIAATGLTAWVANTPAFTLAASPATMISGGTSGDATAARQLAGVGVNPVYTAPTVSVSGNVLTVSFALRNGANAEVGDTLVVTGVRDLTTGNQIVNADKGNGVMTLTLLAPDNGAVIAPQDVVWGR